MAKAIRNPNPIQTTWSDMAKGLDRANIIDAMGWTEDGIAVLAGMVADRLTDVTDFDSACGMLDRKGIPMRSRAEMAEGKITYLRC